MKCRVTGFLLASFYLVAAPVLATEYRDTDWNIGLYDSCTLPCTWSVDDDRMQSVEWIGPEQSQELAVTVLPGDLGGCQSDATSRDGAKFWERAELTQYSYLADGQRYHIRFNAEFELGFTGKRETFFQIHGWSRTCQSAPLMMLQFDWRHLRALVLKVVDEEDYSTPNPRGDLVQVIDQKPELDELKGRTNVFDIQFDRASDPATITLVVNGQVLAENEIVHIVDCAEPRTKFGIYRPGEQNPAPSRVVFDKINIEGSSEPICAAPETIEITMPPGPS